MGGLNVSFILLCPSDLSVWQTLGERFFPHPSTFVAVPPPLFASPPLDQPNRDPSQLNSAHSTAPPHPADATSPPTPDTPPHPPPPPFPLLAIKHAEGAAQATAGHSPFLAFEVRDLQASVEACLRAGGRLDGAIRHGVARGKGSVAAVVAPGGQMVSLFERGEG